MAAQKYIKANLVNLFYNDGTNWVPFAYGQSHGLSVSSQTSEVSSKDHGNHPDQEVTSTSFTLSGSFYFTKENANTALAMANKAVPITWCFAQVSQTDYASGLQPVTNYGEQQAWTPGTDFKQFGEGIVTSFSIESQVGEVATCNMEITGRGALSGTTPSTIKTWTAQGSGTIDGSTGN